MWIPLAGSVKAWISSAPFIRESRGVWRTSAIRGMMSSWFAVIKALTATVLITIGTSSRQVGTPAARFGCSSEFLKSSAATIMASITVRIGPHM